MSEFFPGQQVCTQGGASAVFVKYDGPGRCIIRQGFDTRIVNPVTLSLPKGER